MKNKSINKNIKKYQNVISQTTIDKERFLKNQLNNDISKTDNNLNEATNVQLKLIIQKLIIKSRSLIKSLESTLKQLQQTKLEKEYWKNHYLQFKRSCQKYIESRGLAPFQYINQLEKTLKLSAFKQQRHIEQSNYKPQTQTTTPAKNINYQTYAVRQNQVNQQTQFQFIHLPIESVQMKNLINNNQYTSHLHDTVNIKNVFNLSEKNGSIQNKVTQNNLRQNSVKQNSIGQYRVVQNSLRQNNVKEISLSKNNIKQPNLKQQSTLVRNRKNQSFYRSIKLGGRSNNKNASKDEVSKESLQNKHNRSNFKRKDLLQAKKISIYNHNITN